MLSRASFAAICGAVLLAGTAQAQTVVPPPQPGVLIGQAQVTGANWSFSTTLSNLTGPWGAVTITNTSCTRPFLPGSAQAGAVIFTSAVFQGDTSPAPLQAFKGSAGAGQVQVTPTADNSGTNVSASLSGLEPFVQGTALLVCLTVSPLPEMLAEVYVGQQLVAASHFDVTGVSTAGTDTAFQPLIGITGTQTVPGGTNLQQVFFFVGDTFLGTDTSAPSTAPLQLVGSPGPNQLSVSYADPSGGPPVTITYTLAGDGLTPDGTPPGH